MDHYSSIGKAKEGVSSRACKGWTKQAGILDYGFPLRMLLCFPNSREQQLEL